MKKWLIFEFGKGNFDEKKMEAQIIIANKKQIEKFSGNLI